MASTSKKAKAEKAQRKSKFTVDLSEARVRAAWKANDKNISATAMALGFPKGKGNNRTHAALVKLGLVEARKGDK